ncbi:HDOD domain-containing protein [Solibacillus sp. CAU 1738]
MHEQIVAYELLYRNKNVNNFPLVDSDAATVDVIVNSFLSIGIDEVTNGRPCFVNFTSNLLYSSLLDYLDPTKIVIEILEDVPLTNELVTRVRDLKKRGFKIALDDFVLDEKVEVYDDLFVYIDYIKVDFLLSTLLERTEIESKVKSQFPHIKLLAEKVETRNQFEVAKHAGYTLFQGYFFEQPQIIQSTDIPANTLQYFQIISLLKDEEPNINDLAGNIEREISLTYKLLQLINQSNKRARSKVRSIKQAILLFGLTELRKLIYLLAMREVNNQVESDTFNELMRASLFRAKACERVAKINYKENFSEYFLIGLFSLIDTILKRPMHTILQQLPFSEEIIQTISGAQTEMAPYLQFGTALYKLDWNKLDELMEQLDLAHETVVQIYFEVDEWVKEAFV